MRNKTYFPWTLALIVGLFPAWCLYAGLERPNRPENPPQTQTETATAPEKHTLTLEQRADLFMARKEYADASETYIQALRRAGLSADDTASLWNRLGIAYQAQTKFGPARKAYKNALHYRKDFPEAWNNMGTTYFMQKKYSKSSKYYLRAIKLNNQSASFHMNLGATYYHLNHFDQAVLEYRTALLIDPDILTKHSDIGTVVETREGDPRFYYYLAKSFANLGRVDEAVRYLRRAFEEGFQDLKGLSDDPDFKKISQTPAYVELLKSPPLAIKD